MSQNKHEWFDFVNSEGLDVRNPLMLLLYDEAVFNLSEESDLSLLESKILSYESKLQNLKNCFSEQIKSDFELSQWIRKALDQEFRDKFSHVSYIERLNYLIATIEETLFSEKKRLVQKKNELDKDLETKAKELAFHLNRYITRFEQGPSCLYPTKAVTFTNPIHKENISVPNQERVFLSLIPLTRDMVSRVGFVLRGLNRHHELGLTDSDLFAPNPEGNIPSIHLNQKAIERFHELDVRSYEILSKCFSNFIYDWVPISYQELQAINDALLKKGGDPSFHGPKEIISY